MATLGANSNIIIKNDTRFHRTTTTTRLQCSPSTVAVFKVLSTTRKPQPTRFHFLRHHRNSRGLVCQCQQHHHKGKPDSSPTLSNLPRVSK